MNDRQSVFEADSPAARLRARQKVRRRQLLGFGIRLLLITGLSLWLMHRLGLRLPSEPSPAEPPPNTVTFSDPMDLPR